MSLAMLVMLAVGACALALGADLLVRGAVRLAAMARISSLVIGLTVVAYGTSAPEMAVSIKGALSGQADIALGNVVGSNIINVLLILGVAALIAPLVVDRQLIRLDVPLMIAVSAVFWLMASDGDVGLLDGSFLALGGVAYTVFLIRLGRKTADADRIKEPQSAVRPTAGAFLRNFLLVFGGLTLLVLGARWFVDGATELARFLGVGELVIGLTIVAAGTSLPEAATSIMAAIKGERGIAIGNVIGSNIFNVLAVMGFSAVAAPDGIRVSPRSLGLDFPVMAISAAICLPVFCSGRTIDRWEGGVFAASYAGYAAWLMLETTHHPLSSFFAGQIYWLALLPVLAVTAPPSLRLFFKKQFPAKG